MAHFINCSSCGKQYNEDAFDKCPHCGFNPNTSGTVFCSNNLCGKEFHKGLKQCPFCGTENPQYCKESANKHIEEETFESSGKKGLSIWISVVVTLVALALLSFLQVTLNIDGVLIMYIKVGLALSCGTACYMYLKEKFSSK